MKEALLTMLVLSLVFAAGFFLVPRGDETGGPDLLRPDEISEDPKPRALKGEALDMPRTRGEDVYSPQMETAVIDGKEVTWPSMMFWCKSFTALDEERYAFKDLRLVANVKPKDPEDLARIVRIPDGTPTGHIGDLMLELMGEQVSGLQAASAIFVGGKDLSTARRIELSDGVQIHLRDPRNPARHALIVCPTLLLDLNDGEAMVARTDERVQVTSPFGTLRGTGFELDQAAGTVTLLRDVEGEIKDLSLFDRKGLPVTIAGNGPLRYVPRDARTDEARRRPHGSFSLDGNVVLRQGEFSAQGQSLTVETGRKKSQVVSFILKGEVAARTTQGNFNGSLVTWARNTPGDARLVIEGSPIAATLEDAARMLPGIGASGNLDLTTDGTVIFDNVDAPADGVRVVEIGPVVVLSNAESRLDAERIRLFLRQVPRNTAGEDPRLKDTFPTRVEVEGSVRGSGPTGVFSGERLIYSRTFDASGLPLLDRIELHTHPKFSWLPVAKAGDGASPKRFLAGAGPLHVEARHSLILTTDPLRMGEVAAEARGAVVIRRMDGTGQERARLLAEEVDLAVAETWRPGLQTEGASVKFVSKRTVESVEARGNVLMSTPDGMAGEGDILTYARPSGEIVLTRKPLEGVPGARVDFHDKKGRKQMVVAPRISYRADAQVVTASGGAHAEVFVAPITYGKTASKEPVKTVIDAGAVTAWFFGSPEGAPREDARRRGIREVLANRGVDLTQETGTRLSCQHLRVDLQREETLIRGAPATVVIVREIEGRTLPERLVTPSLTVSAGQGLLRGPLTATFHARRQDLAMKTAARSGTGSGPVLPIEVKAAGDLFVSEERILARGPATITQGDPARDGFHLAGERVVLFLLRGGTRATDVGAPTATRREAARDLEIVRAVVEGQASFRSPELEGSGDVMEFDVRDKVVTLYRYQGDASLTWRHRHQIPRPRFDLDLSNPDNPVLVSSLSPPSRGPR